MRRGAGLRTGSRSSTQRTARFSWKQEDEENVQRNWGYWVFCWYETGTYQSPREEFGNWGRREKDITLGSEFYADESSKYDWGLMMQHLEANMTFLKRFYLLNFRQRGREGEREGEEHQHCGCLSHTPHLGPGLQLRHVPWLGIEPATLWFPGGRSIHGATPARAGSCSCILNQY